MIQSINHHRPLQSPFPPCPVVSRHIIRRKRPERNGPAVRTTSHRQGPAGPARPHRRIHSGRSSRSHGPNHSGSGPEAASEKGCRWWCGTESLSRVHFCAWGGTEPKRCVQGKRSPLSGWRLTGARNRGHGPATPRTTLAPRHGVSGLATDGNHASATVSDLFRRAAGCRPSDELLLFPWRTAPLTPTVGPSCLSACPSKEPKRTISIDLENF